MRGGGCNVGLKLSTSSSPHPLLILCSPCPAQDLHRGVSATISLAVRKRSTLSTAPATKTADTTAIQCVAPTLSSTRTAARWRRPPAATGPASSRYPWPSAPRVWLRVKPCTQTLHPPLTSRTVLPCYWWVYHFQCSITASLRWERCQ